MFRRRGLSLTFAPGQVTFPWLESLRQWDGGPCGEGAESPGSVSSTLHRDDPPAGAIFNPPARIRCECGGLPPRAITRLLV